MLINVDAKGLEWVVAAYLSGDKVAKREINQGLDQHRDNQRTLGLPSRLVAKKFLFRTIYCDEQRGGAFAFANDPEFTHVSRAERWWQDRINTFFTKYEGLAKWHANLLTEVGSTGRWTSPTGRTYVFSRRQLKNGDKVWHKPTLYNWPVQGLGADLMSIARASMRKRLREGLMVCTVHDSILIDARTAQLHAICNTIEGVFKDVPRNFEKLFGVPFDLPFTGEISVGSNWGNLTPIDMEVIHGN